MAHIGVSITKRVTFRDSVQDFSNVYHYTWVGANPGESLATEIIDDIVVREKAFHATSISFMYGRVWSAGGSVSENAMITQKTLSGAGALTASSAGDIERAVLVMWPAGTDSRGHTVYLRKWYHTDAGTLAGVAISNAILKQTTGFTTANRSAIAGLFTWVDGNTDSATPFPMNLCAPSGRTTTGSVNVHKYLEHHQLGDMWRAT